MKKPDTFAPMFNGTEAELRAKEQARTEGYTAGAQAVLFYLKDIFEDIQDTDLWAEFDMDNYTD